MNAIYYIGLDIHKKTIAYSKDGTWMSGRMIAIVWTIKKRLKGLERVKGKSKATGGSSGS